MKEKTVYNRFFDKEKWENVLITNKIILDDYILELKQARRAQGTIAQYYNDLRIFLIYIYDKLDNKNILDMTRRNFRDFSIWLIDEKKVSVARHNRMASVVRAFYNFIEEDDEIELGENLARRLKSIPKEPVREVCFVSDEDVLRIKDELIKREMYQHAVLFMLAYDSAGRRNELAQVTKESFYDEALNNTNPVLGKGRKVFPLVYFSGTKECAKLYLDWRGEDNISSMWVTYRYNEVTQGQSYFLYTMFSEIKDIMGEMGINNENFGSHAMRHSSLQNLADGTHYICRERNLGRLDLSTLKEVANHSSVSTTEGYLKDNKGSIYEDVFGVVLSD